MRPETNYARTDGVSIAYQLVGEGPLDLVLVPSFVSHVEVIWEEPNVAHFLTRLASFSRLILFDKRTRGQLGSPIRARTSWRLSSQRSSELPQMDRLEHG